MSADADPILECLREDVKKGCLLPLSAYLSRFPGQDRAVARAYLTMAGGEARNGEARGHHQIGHYEILRELGRGGQGIVYLAQDTRLERRVALKVLAQIGPGSEAAIDRFRREALVASRLNHPHICGVFDAGSEGGLPYIAMQYVEGMTLSQRIGAQRSGTAADESSLIIDFSDATELDPKEGVEAPAEVRSSVTSAQEIPTLLRYFERVARALHAAHEVGIVHRDIKPGNLMITKQGEPVILDFGLAHADDSAAPGMTRTGDVFGTPAYMAPEQISGHSGRVDRRADVYSVGVAMFEALTLKRPFEAPTREALYQAILTEPPPDPRPLNPAISRDLKVLLETALEKDRDRRYASASALADDILAILEHRPIRARAIGPTGRLVRWARREPAKAALLLVLLVALPAVAALVTARMKDAPKLEAARRAEAAHEQDQRLAEANFEMSEGDKLRAIALYERALADDPACGEAVVGLVLSHQNLGHLDVADRVLEEHQAVLGEGSATKLLKAQSWVLRGREDEARQIIGKRRLREPALSTTSSRSANSGSGSGERSPLFNERCTM
jgi:serine/threonine protein kinase